MSLIGQDSKDKITQRFAKIEAVELEGEPSTAIALENTDEKE